MIFTFISGDQINLGLGLFLYSFRFNGIFESILYYLINYINPDFNYISGFCSITLFLIYSIFFIKKNKFRVVFWKFYFFSFLFFPVNHPWYYIPMMGLVFDKSSLVKSEIISILLMFSYINYSDISAKFKFIYNLFEIILIFGVLYGKSSYHYIYKKYKVG